MRRKTASLVATMRVACFTSLLIFPAGCRSRQEKARPAIEFVKIPPAAQGGREKVDTIAGRVVGARPGQRIVVYARSGPWWVQPWPDQPFIPIQVDSTWSTSTHLGFEYAALLVDPYDVDALRDGIRTLDADEALRDDLSARGRLQAAKFSPERYRERLAEAYRPFL